jgi:hypothetical protein
MNSGIVCYLLHNKRGDSLSQIPLVARAVPAVAAVECCRYDGHHAFSCPLGIALGVMEEER